MLVLKKRNSNGFLVNYTLFYAYNETEGLDFNQTHILSGKTISIDYNTDWDANFDITQGFLLSYEIRIPNQTTTDTSTITPDIPNAPSSKFICFTQFIVLLDFELAI